MSIMTFIKNLFGQESNQEVQQPSSLGNAGKRQPMSPNLGKRMQAECDTVSADVQENNPPKEEPQLSQQEQDNLASKAETPRPDEVKENLGMPEEKKTDEKSPNFATYNLIILDESGSMSPVRNETISGCNETLNSIRNTAKENKEIKQYVSIFCFDTTNSRYLFHNVPVDETRDLTKADYCPNACTPLYDAVGYTVTQLSRLLANSESVGVVTIITDGYENASRRWSHRDVVQLIERLKKRGWTFTFIGANIDVEKTANSLGIDSRMKFEQTEEGMATMFEAEKRSRRAYNAKLNFLRRSRFYIEEEEEKRRQDLGALNRGYFVEEERVASNPIERLSNEEVFVFGSNIHGQHNGGDALYALEHFGAINGQAEGPQGRCYAIPTVGNSFEDLKAAVERFNEYVVKHPYVKFMLTAIGCGASGYGVEQIAPLFRQAYSFGNVYVPIQFMPYMSNGINF